MLGRLVGAVKLMLIQIEYYRLVFATLATDAIIFAATECSCIRHQSLSFRSMPCVPPPPPPLRIRGKFVLVDISACDFGDSTNGHV